MSRMMLLLAVSAWAQLPTGVQYEAFYDQTKISFDQPTFVGGVPGDADQLIVVERAGKVFRLAKNGTGYEKKPWFSVDANTATHWDGAWVVEFHPNFAQNRLFYFLYRQKANATKSVLEEWKVDAGSLDNPRKVRAIMEFTQAEIHSSGDLHFGPDGYLYTSQGDRNTPGWAQDPKDLVGKVSRIDVNAKDPGLEYAVPADNPFVGQAGKRPEIWAIGFRMPYRFSFDKLNGNLWLGDVGDVTHEEVDLVGKGMNYGATTVEGACTANCAGFVQPLLSLSRTDASCIIGGFVYRSDPASQFYGVYLFGDYEKKTLYGVRLNDQGTGIKEWRAVSGIMPGSISCMGQDAAGMVYAAMYTEAGTVPERATQIYRLKHAQLKPMPVALFPTLPARLGAGGGSARLRAYGLDGRLRPAGGGASPMEILILRDGPTGRMRKWIALP